jgi:hypothetical protein
VRRRLFYDWPLPRLLRLFLLIIATVGATPARAERLPIQSYGPAEGLPSTFVLHVMRDSRGFVWFSTRDGLSRFDGVRFVTYGTKDGLPDPTVNALLERRDGSYWIATNGGGACQFDPDTAVASSAEWPHRRLFRGYPVGRSAGSNRVNTLFEDDAGRLWAGTDAGLFRLDRPLNRPLDRNRHEHDGWTFTEVSLGIPDHLSATLGVSAIAEDAGHTLWIALRAFFEASLEEALDADVRDPIGFDAVAAYVDGTMADVDREIFESRLADDATLQADVADLTAMGAVVPQRVIPIEAPGAARGTPGRLARAAGTTSSRWMIGMLAAAAGLAGAGAAIWLAATATRHPASVDGPAVAHHAALATDPPPAPSLSEASIAIVTVAQGHALDRLLADVASSNLLRGLVLTPAGVLGDVERAFAALAALAAENSDSAVARQLLTAARKLRGHAE